MRLLNGLALAGLAGLAVSATNNEAAEVYILSSNPSSSSSSTPQIPRQVARHILLQRVRGETQLNDLPNTITEESALAYISQYGKSPRPLFADAAPSGDMAPSQLVVVLEGVTDDNARTLTEGLRNRNYTPAFHIAEAPSAKANKHLVDTELAGLSGSCDVTAAINPYGNCWNGMSLVVKYDIGKNPSHLQSLIDNLPTLSKSITSGTLEATLVLLPESTRSSKHAYWSTGAPPELRRRSLSESPMSDIDIKVASPADTSTDTSTDTPVSPYYKAAADKMNLGCFVSQDNCVKSTNNCTGHGVCVDKYAVPGQDTQEGDKVCFVCSCLSTKKYPEKENSKHVHWGGAYCQKIDVSSPFWLLVGTTIVLVGLVTGCIVMLFSVGEEKLPGVIGAGVSRSK